MTDWPQETGAGHPRKPEPKKTKRDVNRDSDDRLRDLPELLEEFTDNLGDTKMHVPAHISHDSDSERLAKVASK